MKIMFVGLGLIGGSMAMALEGYPDLERYAVDGDEPTRLEALGRGVVRAAWPNADDAPVEDMDIIVICLHPEAAADFVRAQAGRIRPGALLTDVCGVKRPLFEAVGEVRERTFIYLGGHPMAGRERGGFAHATADLFRGAHYILTPDAGVPQESIRLMERLMEDHADALTTRFKLKNNALRGVPLLEEACRCRGWLLPGGVCDTDRGAAVILDEFRAGKLGRITLQKAPVKAPKETTPEREAKKEEQTS